MYIMNDIIYYFSISVLLEPMATAAAHWQSSPVFEEHNILFAITLHLHVMDVHLVHNSAHESIVHVVVNVGRVEDQIVQHILNQIPDNSCIHLLQSQFLKILKQALARGERATVFCVQRRNKSSL